MRAVIWLVLLFVAAVVAATSLGSNDGLASFYWSGWRFDMSLNLFILLLLGTCFVLVTVMQAVSVLDRSAAARSRMANLAPRPQCAGRLARIAGAIFRWPLQPLGQRRATRAGDPGRYARAGAGQRFHRAGPSAACRQRAPPAKPPAARSATGQGARPVAAQPGGALGRRGRTAAGRRICARRPRCRPRAGAARPSCRRGCRGEPMRCG